MDLNKLLQGVGGRLLRQMLGSLMKQGIERMGRPPAKGRSPLSDVERQKQARGAETQKRLKDIMRIGRRFWR